MRVGSVLKVAVWRLEWFVRRMVRFPARMTPPKWLRHDVLVRRVAHSRYLRQVAKATNLKEKSESTCAWLGIKNSDSISSMEMAGLAAGAALCGIVLMAMCLAINVSVSIGGDLLTVIFAAGFIVCAAILGTGWYGYLGMIVYDDVAKRRVRRSQRRCVKADKQAKTAKTVHQTRLAKVDIERGLSPALPRLTAEDEGRTLSLVVVSNG